MKKIYNILFAASALLGGCGSLDLVPESSIADSGYWQNNSQFHAFHVGIASYFRARCWNYFAYGELRSNIYGGTPFGGEATQGMENLYNNTLSRTTAGISNYGELYTTINQINMMIAKCEESTSLSDSEKANYLGEAYGLRAYLYFHLLRSYGDVIVYTDYTSGSTLDLGNLSRTQDAATEVMAQIKRDIAASENAYADNYEFVNGKYFWSLGATKMLKGEVYLWSGRQMGGGADDFSTAKTALQDVDKCPNITLLEEYGDVFSFGHKANDEIIFAIYYGKNDEITFLSDSWRSNLMPQQAYMTNGLRYTENGDEVSTTDDSQFNGLIRCPLSSDLYQKLYLDNDSRKRINLRAVYQKEEEALVYEGVYPYKYQGTMEAGASVRSMYDDYPIYRYADCLLMLAEAKALLGEDIAGEINRVRQRAYGENYSDAVVYPNDVNNDFYTDNPFVGSDDDPIEAVLKERLRELIFEGKHWYDIRLMDLADKYSSAISTRLLWPIDENTLTANSGLKQTPGYE